MRKKTWVMILGMVGAVLLLVAGWWHRGELARPGVRGNGEYSQDVYVWQRNWNPELRQAIQERGGAFGRVVVLAAQVSWEKGIDGLPRAKVFWVGVEWEALKQVKAKVGLAIRMGEYRGEFGGESAKTLELLAHDLVGRAKANGVDVVELQLDFDAGVSQLGGYKKWVEALQAGVRGEGAGIPVVITALPSWLKHRDFAALVRQSGEYVLQVHSLERPKRWEEAGSLCDPAAARQAVEQAGRIGVPFRVALPTYGYVLVFDGAGKYAGLEAEGPSRNWPENYRKRWLGANYGELAELCNQWRASRPIAMRGIIWYRLPVAGDRANWSWPTLQAVMAGRLPETKLEVEVKASADGARDVVLSNRGDGEVRGGVTVVLEGMGGGGGKMVAGDVLGGFTEVERIAGGAERWRLWGMNEAGDCLGPGQSMKVGWLRLEEEGETGKVELKGSAVYGLH